MQSLLKLGDLRNDMAHGDLDDLEQSRVDGFIGAFPAEHQTKLVEFYKGLPKTMKQSKDFRSQVPENGFAVAAAYLFGALTAATVKKAIDEITRVSSQTI